MKTCLNCKRKLNKINHFFCKTCNKDLSIFIRITMFRKTTEYKDLKSYYKG